MDFLLRQCCLVVCNGVYCSLCGRIKKLQCHGDYIRYIHYVYTFFYVVGEIHGFHIFVQHEAIPILPPAIPTLMHYTKLMAP